MPGELNVNVKEDGGCSWPEVQIPSGVQLTAVQVPDVEEWSPLTHSHSTVVPTAMVVVDVPLDESTKLVPPCPTKTTWFPLGVTVGVNVRVFVGVLVKEFVRVNVKVGVIDRVWVGVEVGAVGVTVNVAVATDVFVRVKVGVMVKVGVIDGVRVGVGEGTVGVTLGVSVLVGVGVMGVGVGVGIGGAGGPKAFTKKTAIWPRITGASGQ